MWMTFGLYSLCLCVVMAGYDIHWSAWVLTRVSIAHSLRCGFRKHCCGNVFRVSFPPSIKPFTQQPYPIQPAVTTAISSETNSDSAKTISLKSDVTQRFANV